MRNWAGNIAFSAEDLVAPATVEELRQVVTAAPRVRALGSRHSFNTVADTVGLHVSTRGLELTRDRVVDVDEARHVAVVPGGATYAEVARELHRRGWALHNMGSLPHISIAGATATGTHGSGTTNGNLSTAVVGLELVLADGELLEVHDDDLDFGGMVLALGTLGVVTRLWLRVEPTYDVAQDVVLGVPLAQAVEASQEILASAHSVSIFSSFAQPGVVDSIWRKQRTDTSPRDETWGGRAATEPVHPIVGLDAEAATEQLGRPGPWHQRLPHFREEFTPSVGEELQSEYFLPREHAGAALLALAEHSADFADALQVFEMRTVAADDLWLSPSHGRDTVAVHATWVSGIERVRGPLTAFEAAIAPFDPRPHWGKVFLGFDGDRLARHYPELGRFRDLAARLDPERCFVNDYLTGLGVR